MNRMLLHRRSAVVAALATLGLFASLAQAATRAPSASERSAIIHAFGDPPAASPCLIVRLAASDPDYGDVRFRMTKACVRWGFNGTNVIERGSAGRWSVKFEGSSYRCPVPAIPRSVQHDLGVCPEP
ncbi:MAG TPA: hypothetical protein VGG41_20915 [Solirubrobacteraceae bacterium]|jgi:hypothetical protein